MLHLMRSSTRDYLAQVIARQDFYFSQLAKRQIDMSQQILDLQAQVATLQTTQQQTTVFITGIQTQLAAVQQQLAQAAPSSDDTAVAAATQQLAAINTALQAAIAPAAPANPAPAQAPADPAAQPQPAA